MSQIPAKKETESQDASTGIELSRPQKGLVVVIIGSLLILLMILVLGSMWFPP